MNRAGYHDSDDANDQWCRIMWCGQVASAIRGRRGQAFLRELIIALDAMPNKRLITNELVRDGEVCAIGSVGLLRGIEMFNVDPKDYMHIAGMFDIAHQLVREIEWLNDDAAGHQTPEQRWTYMRAWATRQLKKGNAQ